MHLTRGLSAKVAAGIGVLVIAAAAPAAANVLNPVQTFMDGVAGVTGLQAVRQVAVSPDGRNVYTAAEGQSASLTNHGLRSYGFGALLGGLITLSWTGALLDTPVTVSRNPVLSSPLAALLAARPAQPRLLARQECLTLQREPPAW